MLPSERFGLALALRHILDDKHDTANFFAVIKRRYSRGLEHLVRAAFAEKRRQRQ